MVRIYLYILWRWGVLLTHFLFFIEIEKSISMDGFHLQLQILQLFFSALHSHRFSFESIVIVSQCEKWILVRQSSVAIVSENSIRNTENFPIDSIGNGILAPEDGVLYCLFSNSFWVWKPAPETCFQSMPQWVKVFEKRMMANYASQRYLNNFINCMWWSSRIRWILQALWSRICIVYSFQCHMHYNWTIWNQLFNLITNNTPLMI